ncbi:MAG: V-type ATP synthase subunit K [Acidobacteria bacterium]|nr:V-type ATP synthase subunit K [Acidobacteriota bacterium]
MTLGIFLAYLGVVFAFLFPGIGSALGLLMTGNATHGALEQFPRRFGRFLPAAALPSSQGIYGFVIAFMLLRKLGTLSTIDFYTGLYFLCSAIPVSVVGFFSALYQARVCVTGIELIKSDETALGKVLTMGVFPELYAILGLMVSLFLVTAK